MIGIYKIQNIINNKIYIGQSVHIEKRWREHCFNSSNSKISQAIKKYGKENFKFSVIEECEITELTNREKYWIEYYNSIVPNGYNVSDNTNTVETTYRFFDKEILLKIISELKTTQLSMKEIAMKYNIDISTVSRINTGESHYQDNEQYPLRPTKNVEGYYCIDCGKRITRGSTRCVKCSNKAKCTIFIPREELKEMIRTKSFVEIGSNFNVSDNAIRKWCKKYNLPFRKKDIKEYSEEDWKLI